MLKPLGNNLLIAPIEDPDISPGGIWLPEQAKQRVDNGVVIERGPLVEDLWRGDHVLFSGYSGDQISHEDFGLLYVIPETHIIAMIEEDEPVMVLSLQTILNVIEERRGELGDHQIFEDLIDRFTNFTTSEGFMF